MTQRTKDRLSKIDSQIAELRCVARKGVDWYSYLSGQEIIDRFEELYEMLGVERKTNSRLEKHPHVSV